MIGRLELPDDEVVAPESTVVVGPVVELVDEDAVVVEEVVVDDELTVVVGAGDVVEGEGPATTSSWAEDDHRTFSPVL